MFADRHHAGRLLGETLAGLGLAEPTPLVLGIPRGGVVVAGKVALALRAPLDIVVPHKIGAPHNPELAIGAVASDGTTVLDARLVSRLGVDDAYLARERRVQRAEIERRLLAYRGDAAEPGVEGRICIVVDDGAATGATAEAAARSLRHRGAARVVVAVPTASAPALERLRRAADDVACLSIPAEFFAVGQWYRDFEQISDEEVVDALRTRR